MKNKMKTEEKTLLTFLQKNKEGIYTPVVCNTIIFPRTTQEYSMITPPDEEHYYYSLS